MGTTLMLGSRPPAASLKLLDRIATPAATTIEFPSRESHQEVNQATREIAAGVQIVSRPPTSFATNTLR